MIHFDNSKISGNYGSGFVSRAFNCPNCKGFSAHNWQFDLPHTLPTLRIDPSENRDRVFIKSWIIQAECQACQGVSFWLKNSMQELLIYPKKAEDISTPNTDMPEDIRQIFEEASLVLDSSPRASAALSRLAIDMLTKNLAPDGRDLNTRIGILVESGMPVEIQQSFDVVRVIGNNAIHPGEIDISDNKEMALALLDLLNIIVDNRITQPRKIAEMYNNLPSGALDAISRRDNS